MQDLYSTIFRLLPINNIYYIITIVKRIYILLYLDYYVELSHSNLYESYLYSTIFRLLRKKEYLKRDDSNVFIFYYI